MVHVSGSLFVNQYHTYANFCVTKVTCIMYNIYDQDSALFTAVCEGWHATHM